MKSSRRMVRSPAFMAVVLSFFVHVATMALLDVVEVSAAVPPEPPMEFLDFAEPEPVAEPEPPVAEPEPATDAPPERVREPRRRSERVAAVEEPVEMADVGLVAAEDLAVDLTSFRLSSTDIGTGGRRGRRAPRPSAPSAGPAIAAAGQGTGFAPASSLSRPPVPPDQTSMARCLERNYPRSAQQRGLAGTARVQLNIRPNGSPGRLRVTSVSVSGQGFGEACTSCLEGRAWSAPLAQNGQPVRTRISYTCRFAVRD